MARKNRLKPFTFFGRVPQGVTTVELTKCLTQKFTKSELGGVQDFTGGKYEIFLKTRAAVERFLTEPVVVIRETAVQFEYRGTRAKVVRVFGYSAEHQDIELTKAMEKYGKILSVTRDSVPGFPSVTTGIRRVKIEMKSPVPNFLEIIDTTVQCEFEGVVRVCRRCGQEGHFGASCDTPQCVRCGAYGHDVCNDPCPKCGEDHAVSQCEKRTFAAVASQGLDGEQENIVVADYWEQARPVFPQLSATVAKSSQDKEKPEESPRPPTEQTSSNGEQTSPLSDNTYSSSSEGVPLAAAPP
ncbi:hypothetical protein HPB49_002039 [Dermacentor silvarum]|uniref:Uncharacterized protein n=1 Tax=Dermacentor silvarum TaxID=543639 RepID=A0ACB8CCU3_DERSI|nr:hypothetical protein HPB49_002039 [Dermacentor silvarum]